MQCPRCQQENPEGARFCEDCGAHLELACWSCGQPVSTGKKFCRSCGAHLTPEPAPFSSPDSYTPKRLVEKILASKSALEGEHKQVTVLFADMKGSMELLAGRDSEEAQKLLDLVLEHMMEAVHRYEGSVNQVMGDGIMALFGAPLAHEDHAVRACYAALRMQESVKRYAESVQSREGVLIQIRVGLNSGDVVVRSISGDLHMDYTAVGQTTYLAARMEQMALPGTILLTPDTLTLADGFVLVKSLGPMSVKGLGAPLDVHELTGASGVRSRLQAAAARGLSRFVGRDSQMEQLRRTLKLAQGGHGQVVAVVGEAGVGKSRLFYEFTHSRLVHGWLVLDSSSVSYGQATSYLPVIDLLKTYFRIEAHDEARKVCEKVTGKLLSLDETLRPTLPAFLALLDVAVDDPQWEALDPPQRRQRTLEAVKRLLLRESQAQPLLLVFEDLHWIDAETQVLLDGLVESLPTARLLLFGSYRPEYRHAWGSKSYYTQLRIDPLAPASAEEMLEALVGADASLEPLKRLLIERTEGNPFFLEESVRTLVETGTLAGEPGAYRVTKSIADVRVPATVEAVLASRMDRLSPEDKRLLQSAAVIGKDAPFGILQEIAEASQDELRQALARLQAFEFLYETRLFPDLEYTFKHALTHEVAYAGLPQARRRALHTQILRALESVFADRLEGQVERLAHHAWHGEMWERAALYARRAGAKAEARSAHREAVACFEQAIAALRRVPQTRESMAQAVDVRFDLRNALLPLAEFEPILDHLRAAEELARTLEDHQRLGRVAAYQTDCYRLVGDSERAIESGQRALAIAHACGDFGLSVSANTYLGQLYQSRGDYPRAIPLFRSNVDTLVGPLALERFGVLQLPSVHSRTCLVWCLAELGAFAEGIARGEEAIRIAESVEHPMNLLIACSGLGAVYLRRGDLANALPVLERGLQVSRLWNIPLWFPRLASELGTAYVLSGRVPDALPLLEQAVERACGMRLRGSQSLSLAALSQGYLLIGRTGDALNVGGRALALAREHGERGHEAWALRLLGEISLRSTPPDHAVAEQYWQQALALARQLGMRPLVAHCLFGLGQLEVSAGNRPGAEGYLIAARALFVELDMCWWPEQADAELKSFQGP